MSFNSTKTQSLLYMRLIPLFFVVVFAACAKHSMAQTTATVKIPIDTTRWYQINKTVGNLSKMFDGDKNTVPFTGWSKILYNYDAYYPLLDGENMRIDSIKFYDKEGVFTNAPLRLYAISNTWERKLIATFVGETYNAWVGPYPSKQKVFALDTPVSNIRYLQLNINDNNFAGEIELYGQYSSPSPNPFNGPVRMPLKNMLGINGFPWDFVNPTNPRFVNETKMKAMKSFGGFRQYMDWEQVEDVQGRYTFSPSTHGGWGFDSIYSRCKAEGIDVLACLQNIPPWMVATYPDSLKAGNNNPVIYGKSFSDPSSYIEQAKLGFQFAARYGSNKNIDSSLVSVYSVPQYYMQPVNSLQIGLGLVQYIECGNETDKWWTGRKGYLTGREYAANLSAFYDGHKGTMGAAVGVKRADSTMKVVMAGTAAASTDFFRGIVDWCKEFRGYKADGTVNLCFDVINFHNYSSDAATSQYGNSTRGAAPEKSNCSAAAKSFVQMAHLFAYDLPVWITEMGYDVNQGSPLKAIPIGNKSALQTQADWILRSALLYAREGLQKAFFYEAYDGNPSYGGQFASMGLLNKSDTTRKPAADFLYQMKKQFGDFVYQQTLSTDPFVDRYAYRTQTMYALAVPDEVGRMASYSLSVGTSDSITIFTPAIGSDLMSSQRVAPVDGMLQLTVTETPIFVVVGDANAALIVDRNRNKRKNDMIERKNFYPKQ